MERRNSHRDGPLHPSEVTEALHTDDVVPPLMDFKRMKPRMVNRPDPVSRRASNYPLLTQSGCQVASPISSAKAFASSSSLPLPSTSHLSPISERTSQPHPRTVPRQSRPQSVQFPAVKHSQIPLTRPRNNSLPSGSTPSSTTTRSAPLTRPASMRKPSITLSGLVMGVENVTTSTPSSRRPNLCLSTENVSKPVGGGRTNPWSKSTLYFNHRGIFRHRLSLVVTPSTTKTQEHAVTLTKNDDVVVAQQEPPLESSRTPRRSTSSASLAVEPNSGMHASLSHHRKNGLFATLSRSTTTTTTNPSKVSSLVTASESGKGCKPWKNVSRMLGRLRG